MKRGARIRLNADQQRAKEEILAAQAKGDRYLLTGYAGSGKTTLVTDLTDTWLRRKLKVAVSAPTHKAVGVLARKSREAGFADVDCRTIQSILSLKPRTEGDRQVFVRDEHPKPVEADVVVVDETSMVQQMLDRFIRRHLPNAFVLHVGDPAQLPPVGERESETFHIKRRSHLDTIERQSKGNPILEAATAIRESQGRDPDFSWVRSQHKDGAGIFIPRDAKEWMKQAFTSKKFDDDPDSFRYLAYTNRRVDEVNAMVREWRYGGPTPTPFMPGEGVVFREPLIRDNSILFNTQEEARVVAIKQGTFRFDFDPTETHPRWTAEVPSWFITVLGDAGRFDVHAPRDLAAFKKVTDQIVDEATTGSRSRWRDLHRFKQSMAHLRALYALTVHGSQGSTFQHTFIDLANIRTRMRDNLLETQQMLYVAATRPVQGLILVNA